MVSSTIIQQAAKDLEWVKTGIRRPVTAVDAEWDSSRNLQLACQFATVERDRAIYLNSDISKFLTKEVFETLVKAVAAWSVSRKCRIVWIEFTPNTNLLTHFLDLMELPKILDLRMFYSPEDLNISLGFENVKPLYLANKGGITQKRNIRGVDVQVDGLKLTIYDLKGWQPQGGLVKLAESVGVEMKAKTGMDAYKSNMLDGLIADTVTFLDYSLGDVEDLHTIYDAFEEFVNIKVIQDILHLEPFRVVPSTTGSLVAKTFEKFLPTQFPNPDAFKLAIKKVGKLPYKADSKEVCRYNRVFKKVKSTDDIDFKDEDVRKLIDSRNFTVTAISGGAVQVLGVQEDSRGFNALVQGGRCNNERSEEYSLNQGLDIDLSSCYGSALKDFTYPIGLPSQYGITGNEDRITLRDFFKKHPIYNPTTNKGILIDGLWTVTVSGSLNYEQDLLFSKFVDIKEINNACSTGSSKEASTNSTDDGELSHIPGVFMLPRKELRNAIITSDIWNGLLKTASDKELSELYNLEVVSACYYSAIDRVDVDKWTDVILASKGVFKTSKTGAGGVVDTRSTKWCQVPISNFMGGLLAERKVVKAKSKELAKIGLIDSTEGREAKAKDSALKLFINTLYGVLCSIYFPVGNSVVANNITARARLGTWMMNKALWTRQSITDGGIYTPLEVPLLLEGKLPGLHILTDWKRWKEGRNRKTTTLGGLTNWTELIDRNEVDKSVDAIALEHINNFWGNYGLKLPFDIEHKLENTFIKAAYICKSHYALLKTDGTIFYRIRGTKDYEDPELIKSPLYELLGNILHNSDKFPVELTYNHTYLLSITKYVEIQNSAGYLTLKDYRPGEEIIESRTFHLNNTYTPVDTVNEYLRRYERRTSKTIRKQKVNIELFEMNRLEGINVVVNNALADRLRGDYKGDSVRTQFRKLRDE